MEVGRILRKAEMFLNVRQAVVAIILALVAVIASTVPQAEAQDTISFDIPEQELNSALLVFADSAGLQLVYDVGFVKGLQSALLRGE